MSRYSTCLSKFDHWQPRCCRSQTAPCVKGQVATAPRGSAEPHCTQTTPCVKASYWSRPDWFRYPTRHLIIRSRKVSNPRDLYLELSDRSEIWQAPRQRCCRGACGISKWFQHFNTQSHAFEIYQILKRAPGPDTWSAAISGSPGPKNGVVRSWQGPNL